MAQQVRDEIPTPDNSTNFNVAAGSETPVGTTLENLKAAVGGETGASAHYSVYADAAEKAGYSQLAALWRATSAAEQIHIAMEYNAVTAEDPDWPRPEVTAGTDAPADLNLISSAQGEIYETSDMYPAFIKKAQEELQTAFYAVAERIYKEQGAAAQQAEAAQTDVQGEGTNAAGGSDDNVVDADYTDAN